MNSSTPTSASKKRPRITEYVSTEQVENEAHTCLPSPSPNKKRKTPHFKSPSKTLPRITFFQVSSTDAGKIPETVPALFDTPVSSESGCFDFQGCNLPESTLAHLITWISTIHVTEWHPKNELMLVDAVERLLAQYELMVAKTLSVPAPINSMQHWLTERWCTYQSSSSSKPCNCLPSFTLPLFGIFTKDCVAKVSPTLRRELLAAIPIGELPITADAFQTQQFLVRWCQAAIDLAVNTSISQNGLSTNELSTLRNFLTSCARKSSQLVRANDGQAKLTRLLYEIKVRLCCAITAHS